MEMYSKNNRSAGRSRWICLAILVSLIAFLMIMGCGGEDPPVDADTGVYDDVEVEEDTSPDVHEGDIEEEQLTPAGESCSECSGMPGDSFRCDGCEDEWCYTPLSGGGAYCVPRCNSDDDCPDEGWTCEGRICAERDRI